MPGGPFDLLALVLLLGALLATSGASFRAKGGEAPSDAEETTGTGKPEIEILSADRPKAIYENLVGGYILASMNKKQHPCQNFHAVVCPYKQIGGKNFTDYYRDIRAEHIGKKEEEADELVRETVKVVEGYDPEKVVFDPNELEEAFKKKCGKSNHTCMTKYFQPLFFYFNQYFRERFIPGSPVTRALNGLGVLYRVEDDPDAFPLIMHVTSMMVNEAIRNTEVDPLFFYRTFVREIAYAKLLHDLPKASTKKLTEALERIRRAIIDDVKETPDIGKAYGMEFREMVLIVLEKMNISINKLMPVNYKMRLDALSYYHAEFKKYLRIWEPLIKDVQARYRVAHASAIGRLHQKYHKYFHDGQSLEFLAPFRRSEKTNNVDMDSMFVLNHHFEENKAFLYGSTYFSLIQKIYEVSFRLLDAYPLPHRPAGFDCAYDYVDETYYTMFKGAGKFYIYWGKATPPAPYGRKLNNKNPVSKQSIFDEGYKLQQNYFLDLAYMKGFEMTYRLFREDLDKNGVTWEPRVPDATPEQEFFYAIGSMMCLYANRANAMARSSEAFTRAFQCTQQHRLFNAQPPCTVLGKNAYVHSRAKREDL